MKISIAMATYNGAAYLEEQLQSFLEQSRLPDELVVTDDASTDGTLDVIRAFAARAPFDVRWTRNDENLGYAANFSKALGHASGDLVFLSDQDDVWYRDKLARIVAEFTQRPEALLVINDADIVTASFERTGSTRIAQLRRGGYPLEKFVQGACTAVRREVLDRALPVPACYTHDSWLHAVCRLLDARVVLEEPLQAFRRHAGNASDSISSRTRPIGMLARAWTGVRNQVQSEEHRLDQVSRYYSRIEALTRWLRDEGPRIRAAGWMGDAQYDEAARRMEATLALHGERRDYVARPRPARWIGLTGVYRRAPERTYPVEEWLQDLLVA